MSQPDAVTVIVVSYRTRELTLRMLERLTEVCVGVPYRTIVVDNGSDDGSADAIEARFPDVHVERLPGNVGFGNAVNHGASLATTSWLLFLNPDTEPVGDVVAELVRFAAVHPGRGIYTGRTLGQDGSDDGRSCHGLPSLWGYLCVALGLSTLGRRARWLNPDELPGVDRSRVSEVPAVSGCLLLIDRTLWTRLGGFTPRYFMYSEDIDLCTRARALGARPLLDPDATITHVGGASSSSAGRRSMVLRGKCTYVSLHFSPGRARAARLLLATGVGLRALGATVLRGRRGGYWREVWRERSVWLAGWPEPDAATAGTSVRLESSPGHLVLRGCPGLQAGEESDSREAGQG